jgi:hypothetical protein
MRLRRRQNDRPDAPVLLVASSGGHLLELMPLRDIVDRDHRRWVTFDRPDAMSMLDGEDVKCAFHPTDRSIKNLALNLLLAWRHLRRVRPRAIVTTGSGVAVPFCVLGRLLGIHVVFIESLTRITSLSLSARMIYPFAHDFFVQWPDLLERYPRAKYAGSIFDLS